MVTMSTRPKVYLAGPEVFLPDAVKVGRAKVDLCARYGLEGLFPLDNLIDDGISSGDMSRRIFEANVDLMNGADAIVANLTPFRGPSADVGTVWELAFMTGCGKPTFAYTNFRGSYARRMSLTGAAFRSADGLVDGDGHTVEDFGLEDNLMIIHGLDAADSPIISAGSDPVRVEETWRDFTCFEQCLAKVAIAFNTESLIAREAAVSCAQLTR